MKGLDRITMMLFKPVLSLYVADYIFFLKHIRVL